MACDKTSKVTISCPKNKYQPIADQFRIRTKTFEITGAVKEKGLIRLLDDVPAKKTVLFCDGEVFFLDRGLLMGAILNNRKLAEIFIDILWIS